MYKQLLVLSLIAISFFHIQSSSREAMHPQNILDEQLIDAIEAQNIPAIRAALEAGANINCQLIKTSRQTPLAFAIRRNMPEQVLKEIMLLLLDEPTIDITAVDQDSWAILHHAAAHTSSLPLRLLLQRQHTATPPLNINQRSDYRNALIAAFSEGRIENAQLLLENNADINAQMQDGSSILHTDLELELMRTAVNYGALQGLKDNNNRTPLVLALLRLLGAHDIHCKKIATLLALGSYSSRADLQHQTEQWSLKELLERAFTTTDVPSTDTTSTDTTSTETLLAKNLAIWLAQGFNLIQRQFHLGCIKSAFNLESRIDDPTMFKEFNINAQDTMGFTALMWMAALDNVELMNYLLKFPGIDVNIQDSNGETALHYAARNGNVQCVKLLLEQPTTKTSLRNKEGLKACDLVQRILKAVTKVRNAQKIADLVTIAEYFQTLKSKIFYAWRTMFFTNSAHSLTPFASEVCVRIAHQVTLSDDISPGYLGHLENDGQVSFIRRKMKSSNNEENETMNAAQAAVAAAGGTTSTITGSLPSASIATTPLVLQMLRLLNQQTSLE